LGPSETLGKPKTGLDRVGESSEEEELKMR
jgi:hypothetical protein